MVDLVNDPGNDLICSESCSFPGCHAWMDFSSPKSGKKKKNTKMNK